MLISNRMVVSSNQPGSCFIISFALLGKERSCLQVHMLLQYFTLNLMPRVLVFVRHVQVDNFEYT